MAGSAGTRFNPAPCPCRAARRWTFMLAAKMRRVHHPAVVHCIDPGAVATKVRAAGPRRNPTGRLLCSSLWRAGSGRGRPCKSSPPCGLLYVAPHRPLQVLLAGWGEVAHSVAMRASEATDLEWSGGPSNEKKKKKKRTMWPH